MKRGNRTIIGKSAFPALAGLVFACTVSGCAAPTPTVGTKGFVPDDEVVATRLVAEGLGHFEAGRFVDAELRLLQALHLFPSPRPIRESLAATLETSGRFDEAVDIYEKLAAEDPRSTKYVTLLARAHYRAGRYEKARILFEKALALATEKSETGLAAESERNLSVIDFRLGREEDSLCHSSIAYSLRSTREEALRHARLLVAINQSPRAIQFLGAFAEAQQLKKDPEVVHQLSLANFGVGNREEAVKLARTVHDLEPVDPRIADENALVLLALDGPGENAGDEEISRLLRLVNGREGAGRALYWPVRLLDTLKGMSDDRSRAA